MQKRLIAFFFLSVFSAFLVMPAALFLMDEEQNITVFFDVNEEEKGKSEVEKKSEVELIAFDKENFTEDAIDKEKLNIEYLDDDSQFYLDNFSPPPEANIL